jgi:hypothetical protein
MDEEAEVNERVNKLTEDARRALQGPLISLSPAMSPAGIFRLFEGLNARILAKLEAQERNDPKVMHHRDEPL